MAINKPRLRRHLIAGGVVGLIAGIVILWPFASNPYVRVPAYRFAVDVQCAPTKVVVHTREADQRPVAASLESQLYSSGKSIPQVTTLLSTVDGQSTTTFLVPPEIDDQLVTETARHRVILEFSRQPFVDITAIEAFGSTNDSDCRGEALAGHELAARIIGASALVMPFRLVQDDISRIIVGTNQTIGNVLLTCMLVGLAYVMWLAMQAYALTLRSFVPSDRASATEQKDQTKGGTIDAEDLLCEGAYLVRMRRLALARVLGPAVGFLLTVSSFAASLSPTVQGQQDSFQFLSAIQIAVLSTFVGLLVRIVAHLAMVWTRDAREALMASAARANST